MSKPRSRAAAAITCEVVILDPERCRPTLSSSSRCYQIFEIGKGQGKGKDVDLYSAFHAPGTSNAHTSLKLTRQTAI